MYADFLGMPIRYDIDEPRSLIRTHCMGTTTLAEVALHFRELRADPRLPKRVNVLLDLTALVSAPERDQLRSVVAEVKDVGASLHWGVCAVAAKTDLLFGMSRIFAVFVEDVFTNTGVFRQLAEAERWLDAQIAER
ncbi:MAG TPA: hypothetical protein VMW19_04890 [Myxococcota bacterium]|nr:hypothetical protein [Myxococcota bacterium]